MVDEVKVELIVNKIVDEINKKHINVSKMENELEIGKTIAFWKRGTQPTVEKLIKVIKYLDLSADELFDIKPKETTYGTGQIQISTMKHWNTKEKYIKLGIDNIINSNSIEEIHENAYMIKVLLEAEKE